MLVTFHTPAAADVVMFGDIAVQLIQLLEAAEREEEQVVWES
ncbi:MAG: DUF1840 family protein [Porticoccus sp.]|jgi:hypothetical protein|tara:strand:- start:1646 stop:1771 length:126 start_codon:yes stop_codon:yes gene_type:complete